MNPFVDLLKYRSLNLKGITFHPSAVIAKQTLFERYEGVCVERVDVQYDRDSTLGIFTCSYFQCVMMFGCLK